VTELFDGARLAQTLANQGRPELSREEAEGLAHSDAVGLHLLLPPERSGQLLLFLKTLLPPATPYSLATYMFRRSAGEELLLVREPPG
jgi:hypothetical protein